MSNVDLVSSDEFFLKKQLERIGSKSNDMKRYPLPSPLPTPYREPFVARTQDQCLIAWKGIPDYSTIEVVKKCEHLIPW